MDGEQLKQVRRFNRLVTRRVGALSDSFLDRGRPLAQARVIYEVGRDGATVRALRARLGLDSGHMSRLLRSLERDGVIETAPDADDQRVRWARLTARGRRELAAYDQGSDEMASHLLGRLSEPRRARLVAAMGEVERLMRAAAVEISLARPDSRDARTCLAEYYAELQARFRNGFELDRALPATDDEMSPPRGAFVVAHLDGVPVGCGGVKSLAPGVGYLKRMWVSSAVRGLGLGRRLLSALEQHAKELGFHTLRLETNAALDEARGLYRSSGYREVPAFNDEPYADHWFEKTAL